MRSNEQSVSFVRYTKDDVDNPVPISWKTTEFVNAGSAVGSKPVTREPRSTANVRERYASKHTTHTEVERNKGGNL